MAKFKKGDRVRFLEKDPAMSFPEPPVGSIGVVLEDDNDIPWVSFPGFNGAALPEWFNPLPDACTCSERQLELIS